MSLQPLRPRYEPYAGAAASWGALHSIAYFWLDSKQPFKNLRALLRTDRNGGFDYPGCAWGDPSRDDRVKFCENGAKAINWETTEHRTDTASFARYSVSALCEQSDYWLEYQDRLTGPMRYDPLSDHYQPITWDAVFTLVAEHLCHLDSPDQAEFYTSGRASGETAYLYQLFVHAFGANNFPDCSNMCHEASGVVLGHSVGADKGSMTFDDFEYADAIFILGQSPGINHPHMLEPLREAVKRGTQIVCFNPFKERGLERFQHPQNALEMLTNGSSPLNTAFFRPALDDDMATIRGIAKFLLTWERDAQAESGESVFDHAFIAEHTNGLEAYLAELDATPWEYLKRQSGLNLAEIEQAARVYRRVNGVIVCWATSITQHHHSAAIIQEVVNLQLLRGNLNRPGADLCPVRSCSNVRNDHAVGINERPPAALLDTLGRRFGFEVPRHNRHNAVEAIATMFASKSKVFIGPGGNFAQATPDSPRTHAALASCDLTVRISAKLNYSHLTTGHDALILPCLGRIDINRQAKSPRAVTVEDSFSTTHTSYEQLELLPQQMCSEPTITASIAKAALGNHPVNWDVLIASYERIHELITDTIPGFADFNHHVRHPDDFYLGNAAGERYWNTASGKASFVANPLPRDLLPAQIRDSGLEPDLILQTLRSHGQYNTAIYGLDDRYRGIKGQREMVLANKMDIRRLGYRPGDKVDLVSLWSDGTEHRVRHFTLFIFDIPASQTAACYPETNPLVPLESVDVGSHTPTSRFIAVRLEKATGDGHIIRSPRKTPPPTTGDGVLRKKSMKGLEDRPLVGARVASIPPARIPTSTLKSRFAFGLRPPSPKKVPHRKQALEIFRACSTNRRLTLVSGLGQSQRRSRHPHREKLSTKYSSVLLLSLSLIGGTTFTGDNARAAIGGTLDGVLGSVVDDAVGGSIGAAIGGGIGGAVGDTVGAGRGNKAETTIGGDLDATGGNVIDRQIGSNTGGLIGATLGGAGDSALGNHYGGDNRRYDDDDDYHDRRYYRRTGYRDGYYRYDSSHHYGRYKKWKRHKHHRRHYDD